MKNTLPILMILFFACKTVKNNSDQEMNIDQVASETLKEEFTRSDKGEYALFYTTSKTPGIFTRNVLVLNVSSGEPIYGPTKLNADVAWHEENILVIKEYPGVIEDTSKKDAGPYYYNILTKKKFSDFR